MGREPTRPTPTVKDQRLGLIVMGLPLCSCGSGSEPSFTDRRLAVNDTGVFGVIFGFITLLIVYHGLMETFRRP